MPVNVCVALMRIFIQLAIDMGSCQKSFLSGPDYTNLVPFVETLRLLDAARR